MVASISHNSAKPLGSLTVVVTLGLMVAGCSWIPDWANPMTAYDRVFSSSTPPPPQRASESERKTLARKDDKQQFPNLASVPDKAPATSDEAQRRQVASGLVADRQNARYTDEKPAATEQAAPAPPAVPPVPVQRAPAGAPTAVASAPPPATVPSIVQAAPRAVQPTQPPAAAQTPAQGAPPFPTTVLPRQAQPLQPPSAGPTPVAPTVVAPRPATPVQTVAAAPPPVTPPALAQTGVVRPAGAVQLGGYTTSGTSVAQVFAEKIAQSSATVTTLPTHMGFQQGSLPTSTALAVTPQGSLVLPAGSPAPSFTAAQTQVGSAPSPAPTTARAGQLRVPIRAAGGPAGSPVVVKFEHGSAQIGETVRARLKALADEQKARGGTIVVVGHASSRTRNLPVDKHKLANFGISLDRAQAVARELMRMGVAPQAIAVEARGDSDPIYHESMPAGEAENRRVEVFLHS